MHRSDSHYSIFHKLFQKLASTRLVSGLFSFTAHRVDQVFLRLSRGRITLTTILSGLPVIVLTTTGARSGLPRRLPVAYIHDPLVPGQIGVVASNFGKPHHPAWYFNLKANPHAIGAIKGVSLEFLAHEAYGDEYERLWSCAEEVFMGYPIYQLRAEKRRIPILVLTPEDR
jgi:deazaflavin-dependent oxidoreductase (nitroreductase family)